MRPRASAQTAHGPSVAISLADVLVRDVMTKPVTMVQPDTSVFAVLEVRRRQLPSEGLRSRRRPARRPRADAPRQRCFLRRTRGICAPRSLWSCRAAPQLLQLHADTAACSRAFCAQLLVNKSISGVPVVDSAGKVLGMIRRVLNPRCAARLLCGATLSTD
jgi:CBS domain-containing protein